MLEPRVLQAHPNSRSLVTRRALMLTPVAVVLIGLLAWTIPYLPDSIFGFVVMGIGAVTSTLEAVAALRDLRATPMTTRGRVNRLWKKSRFLVFGRTDYALVDRRLFEVNAVTAMELHEGDDVIIEHWPHTNIVISLARPPYTPVAPSTPPA